MREKIEPALTPDVWQKILHDGRDASYYDDAVGVDAKAKHYVAALNLHGQPFGFTREDVRLLRDLIWSPDDGSMTQPEQARIDRLQDSLADRIEALLPPETPDVPG